jgi:hypothetical protein
MGGLHSRCRSELRQAEARALPRRLAQRPTLSISSMLSGEPKRRIDRPSRLSVPPRQIRLRPPANRSARTSLSKQVQRPTPSDSSSLPGEPEGESYPSKQAQRPAPSAPSPLSGEPEGEVVSAEAGSASHSFGCVVTSPANRRVTTHPQKQAQRPTPRDFLFALRQAGAHRISHRGGPGIPLHVRASFFGEPKFEARLVERAPRPSHPGRIPVSGEPEGVGTAWRVSSASCPRECLQPPANRWSELRPLEQAQRPVPEYRLRRAASRSAELDPHGTGSASRHPEGHSTLRRTGERSIGFRRRTPRLSERPVTGSGDSHGSAS